MTSARAPAPLVLVVDDDPDIREIVMELLQDRGLRAEGASNGQVALDRLEREGPGPDLILLDLLMPVMDGPAFRKAQLASVALSQIPVVVISANARVEETAAEMDVTHWLRKPFELRALLECVSKVLPSPATGA